MEKHDGHGQPGSLAWELCELCTARCYKPPMDQADLRDLLERLRGGQIDVDEAASELQGLSTANLDFARVDHQRALRQGVAEVVFSEGKTSEQVVAIVGELRGRGHSVLATRLNDEQSQALSIAYPDLSFNRAARTASLLGKTPEHRRSARVMLITAGTSDLPVAEEAFETLKACGVTPARLVDVGVAGLHRLLPEINRIREADVCIVVAGMEGALASVVGGLVAKPVIAVPTSVGYGAALSGVAALLGMLTSCASGVTVVNIDNGFGAAIAAVRIIDSSQQTRNQAIG